VKAVAALGAAVALIVAAILARDALDDDGDSAGGSSAGPGTTLVCPPELADACAELEDDVTVRVEAASVTADGLTTAADADEAGADVWLAPAPWAEVVADARERAGAPALVGEPSAVDARSPVVPTLRQIAEATSAAVYDSSDPTSIGKVFTAVVSNF
jgi:hypothetical protein